jgi:iron complex outermembrane receptor protein
VTGNPDVDGHHLGGAPALSGNFGVEYKRPVMAGVDGYGRVDVIYEGRIYEDETNLAWIPANSKVNLRLGAQYGVMTFEGYVTNLFDDLSYTDAQRAVDVLRNYTNTVSAGLPVRRTLGFRFRAAL